MMYAIRVHGVKKIYDLEKEKDLTLKEKFVNIGKKRKKEKIVALDNVSFEVKKGECFGILGKNGAGKTTLLKIIAGIVEPDDGTVEVNGVVLPLLSLGLGFQRELTARENIYLQASIFGLSEEETDRIYDKIVEFSELKDMMDVKLKDFSSGMLARLSFSIGFHINADIILIDEILAVGDASFQLKCLDKIKELRSSGKTIVLVSHSTDDIRKFCDRAMILHEGKIVFIGSVDGVCKKYDEIVEKENIERWNRDISNECGINFKILSENTPLLKEGSECTIEVWPVDKKVELLFNSTYKLKTFTKNIRGKKALFETKSLPIPAGKYDVWVVSGEKKLNKRPFRVSVKPGESDDNKVYVFPCDGKPFESLTLVFGDSSENEMLMFKNGNKTIFVFDTLEEAKKYSKKASLFFNNKLIVNGDVEEVMKTYKGFVWKYYAEKYFISLLSKTNLGRLVLGKS